MMLLSAVFLLTSFLGLMPLLVLLFAVFALLFFRTSGKITRFMLKLHRATKWSWPIYFLPVAGGTTVGPNTEIDSTARLANLEAACFEGGISVNPAIFQGALAPGVQKITASATAILVPGGTGLNKAGGAACLSGGTIQTNLTLALPLPGSQATGGQDGTLLFIFNDTAAKAWEFSGPGATTFNGTLTHCTMSSTAATFSAILLIAFNGSWYVIVNTNCTLS